MTRAAIIDSQKRGQLKIDRVIILSQMNFAP